MANTIRIFVVLTLAVVGFVIAAPLLGKLIAITDMALR